MGLVTFGFGLAVNFIRFFLVTVPPGPQDLRDNRDYRQEHDEDCYELDVVFDKWNVSYLLQQEVGKRRHTV